MNFFNTFRGRLLVILAFLLVATLGVQLYVNLKNRRENIRLREMQEQALVAGMALGANSMTSGDRLQDFVKREGQSFFDEKTTERIKDIIIINPQWQVWDSLSSEYLPTTDDNDETVFVNFSELTNLPPLLEGNRLGEDLKKFPNADINETDENDGEAHAFPLDTNQGRFYVCLLYTSPSPRDRTRSRMPSSA